MVRKYIIQVKSNTPSIKVDRRVAKSKIEAILLNHVFPAARTEMMPAKRKPNKRMAKVINAAIIWFSVKADTNSPIARQAAPNKKKPKIAV